MRASMSSLRVVTTAQALRTLCRRQSRCSPQRSTAIRPLTRPVRSRPTLLLPLSSSPSWFGSYASDAPRPVQRQNATLPSRLFSAVVAKTDSVRQTRFPNALPINRQRDLRGPAALPREIDQSLVAHCGGLVATLSMPGGATGRGSCGHGMTRALLAVAVTNPYGQQGGTGLFGRSSGLSGSVRRVRQPRFGPCRGFLRVVKRVRRADESRRDLRGPAGCRAQLVIGDQEGGNPPSAGNYGGDADADGNGHSNAKRPVIRVVETRTAVRAPGAR